MDTETKKEIFSQRLVAAVIWNIGLQTFLAVALIFVIQVDLLHPLSWIYSTIYDILGWKMILNIFLLGLVSFLQAYIYGRYFVAPLPKYFTRFTLFLNMFTIQNATFTVLYALSSYFTISLYSSLAKSEFTLLKKKCDFYDGQCLKEQSLFLQFGGMWMGIYYFLNTHVFSSSILFFPHIYQDKLQQLKLSFSQIFIKGFQSSITPVIYFSVFYYIWGSKPRAIVSDVYSLYLEDPPLDVFINLISSGVYIGLWFYTSLFLISVYTMQSVFNIILTEPMKFSIESKTELTLHAALEQRSKFIGYLGAADLKLIALTDPLRRHQIFMLSQPGGHPRNWKTILESSLYIINNFCKELESISGEIKPVENGNLNIVKNTSPTSIKYSGYLRNMAKSPQLNELKDHNKNKIENTFADAVKDEFNLFLVKLCQKPGISYIFGELNDIKLKYLLLQSQPVMWVCEGLAFISAASLNEDKYGIVQNDLSTVIIGLVNLKQSLEKLARLGIASRKLILNDNDAIKMKSALMSSVKRSIYKIVTTFSKYINEIPLDHDVRTAIQPFLLYKEA